MPTTVTSHNIGDLGYPRLPKYWSLNVDTDDATTPQIIKTAEVGKKHWISRVTAIGAPESAGAQWFKIKSGNNLVLGPFHIIKGVAIDVPFAKPIAIAENTDLLVQTKNAHSLMLLLEGRTDAYGTLAYTPSPALGATGVTVDSDLGWGSAPFVVSHDVYFGTTPVSLSLLGSTAAKTYDPGLLANNMTYYWRINCFDGVTTIVGDLWSFITAIL